MTNPIDMTGQKFNRLTAIRRDGYMYKHCVAWLCRCDCGNYKTLPGFIIRSGHTKSCGCIRQEGVAKQEPIYRIWLGMMSRCGHRPGAKKRDLKNYANRGICVCKEWQDPKVFMEWAEGKGWKKELCIDRDNNNGNYEPANCRFVTIKVNSQNSRKSKRWYVDGVKYNSLRDAALALDVSHDTIHKWCTENKKGCYATDLYLKEDTTPQTPA